MSTSMLVTAQFPPTFSMKNRKLFLILLVLSYYHVTDSIDSSAEVAEDESQENSLETDEESNPSLNATGIVAREGESTESILQSGMMGDNVAEVYNFLDGDSFGIGPMHEFVYGWQAILNAMSMKNNVEVRKRAGMQRMALAGLNGISLISHIGVTQVMINGTRVFCFGGVVRPVVRPRIVCKGAMYQEARIKCKLPYLRYAGSDGHQVCVGQLATVKLESEIIVVEDKNITRKVPMCYNGMSFPKFHYDYICERSLVRIKKLNFSDPNERFNIRNPIVRRVEYYRSENDILKQCADWYGCNFRIAEEIPHDEANICLLQGNETAFVGFGGRYWLSVYYAKLSSWARYFQSHAEYPWYSTRPIVPSKGGIWDLLMKINIGPDMNLHYNLNGIYNRYPPLVYTPNIINNDGQVQPANLRNDWKPSDDAAIEPFPRYREIAKSSLDEAAPRVQPEIHMVPKYQMQLDFPHH